MRASTGQTNREIARELGVSPLTVACWKSRFALLGTDGISRDAPRFGSRRTLSDSKLREILETTARRPPPSGTSWSSRTLARAVGVSHSTVLRVWRAHPARRDRTRLAALAHDPRFQPRSIDLSGVYLRPPHAAIVISDSAPRNSRSPRNMKPARPTRSRVDRTAAVSSTIELVQLLARLESGPAARSSARIARKEFLAFLGSVADHSVRGARTHLLVAPGDESLRPIVAKWSSREHEISLASSEANLSLHELVAHWLSEQSRNPRTEIALTELPRLRQAVDQWASNLDGEVRPFAWVNAR